ncbi:MAG: TonB-dependent receptor plug domain-containing protein [Betaproteobacteria bacterium]
MRFWTAAALALGPAAAAAQGATLAARDLADLSLEQLANVVVTSVSRRDEPLSRAPASIYVISAGDIRRSGATSLPEALRLAPNLQVARVDSRQYAITARGFNSTTANKLLVLIDGRTVYTPLFSGTFWEAQDVMLEDVERIEVISGPGATLWGANAVNCVINVITKDSADTVGGLAAAGLGNNDRQVAMRHGGELSGGRYRVYAKAARRDDTALPGGASNRDQADHGQFGFRADWRKADEGFTLQGDLYGGEIDQATTGAPREIDGLNLLARWTRDFADGGLLRVQAYFDHTHREHPGLFKENLDTYDLEVQHGLRAYGRHRLLWGLGARHHDDRIGNSAVLAFMPAQRTLNSAHAFLQDEIALRPGLDLTLGAKSERNTYTGTEFLPSARLAWQPAPTQLLWTALSRAVRAPARLDRDFFVPGVVNGGPEFRSEVSRVFELGYRAQAAANLSFSITGFHHEHEDLRSLSPSPAGPVIANDREGHTSGVEAWASWRGADWWRIDAGAAFLDRSLEVRPGATDLQTPASLGADPDQWAKLRAGFDLGASRELDFMLRHYGSLDTRHVPAYTALDARLAWHPRRNLELSLLLQNLLDARHVEWSPGAEFERAAFFKVRVGLQ